MSPTKRLDFSEGDEPQLEVVWEGWSSARKDLFKERAAGLPGVREVRTAGGNSSLYIRFDPNITDAEHLEIELAELRTTARGDFPEGRGDPPHSGNQSDDAAITDVTGKQVIGEDGELLVSTEYLNDMQEAGDFVARQDPIDKNISSISSTWTGVQPGAIRVRAVQAMMPAVAEAVSALIVDLEGAGGNGGPPLQEREDALATLRKLHTALGEIIELADNGALESGLGFGLLADAAELAARAKNLLKSDPLRFSVVAIAATLAAALGPGGALLAGLAAVGGILPQKASSTIVPPAKPNAPLV